MDEALGSLTNPSVGAMTVSDVTWTRMPSRRSNGWPAMSDEGVISTGCGSGFPRGDEGHGRGQGDSSVIGGLHGIRAGTNSCTVAVTVTSLPTAAAAGGALLVNTKIPSEVAGSVSACASGVCRKKPLVLRAVTTPVVVTNCPSYGERASAPWIWAMVRATACTVIVVVAVLLRSSASETVKVRTRGPEGVPGATVTSSEKVRSPAVTSPLVPSSNRGEGFAPPMLVRSAVTARPLLVGLPPGVTATVSSELPPAGTELGFAAAVPLGAVGPPQPLAGLALLRGVGAPTVKSELLLSVSVQPPRLRRAAVVLERTAVGPAPSKSLAPP